MSQAWQNAETIGQRAEGTCINTGWVISWWETGVAENWWETEQREEVELELEDDTMREAQHIVASFVLTDLTKPENTAGDNGYELPLLTRAFCFRLCARSHNKWYFIVHVKKRSLWVSPITPVRDIIRWWSWLHLEIKKNNWKHGTSGEF